MSESPVWMRSCSVPPKPFTRGQEKFHNADPLRVAGLDNPISRPYLPHGFDVGGIMPTYEYRCNACGIEFEVEKRMSDPVATACTSCGAMDTERLISHSSFVLKGSGWYLTDYARKNGSSGNGGATKHEHKNGDSKPTETAAVSATSDTASAPTPAPAAASAPAAPSSSSPS